MPRRWVTLDSEAYRNAGPKRELHSFRLAVASFDHQERRGAPWKGTDTGIFHDPTALWKWVDGTCVDGKRTVLVAHNLGYDLRVCQAFTELPALGWSVEMIGLDRGSTWASWRNGPRSLTMVDSMSWWGCSLERVGELLGVAKKPLPADDDSDELWQARCMLDVAILRCAWLRTLDWLERGDFGTWKPTGAGQGWAAFRHRWMDTRILHHGVPSVAAAEREAAYMGRCEAWKWGRLKGGPFTEWDFEAAYANICADTDLPVRMLGHLGPRGSERALDGAEGRRTLVRATVTQSAPIAPTRGPHGILWPVGSFSGWYWDIELAEVRRSGGTVEAHEGWSYEALPALRTWASWVLDRLGDVGGPTDPLARLVIKGWSRSLVGRFGSRWAEWEPYGEAGEPGVHLSTVRDVDADRTFRMLTLGDRCIAEADAFDAPDGAVAVMSYVMTVGRLRLLALMALAGVENVAYVDTDGILCNAAGSNALRGIAPRGVREKSRYARVEVLGPRQVVLDGKLRAAGVSTGARRVAPDRWAGEVWQGMGAALASGDPGGVAVTPRTWRLRGTDHRRLHLPGGETAPIAL
jgi:hypothetical protein